MAKDLISAQIEAQIAQYKRVGGKIFIVPPGYVTDTDHPRPIKRKNKIYRPANVPSN